MERVIRFRTQLTGQNAGKGFVRRSPHLRYEPWFSLSHTMNRI